MRPGAAWKTLRGEALKTRGGAVPHSIALLVQLPAEAPPRTKQAWVGWTEAA